MTVNLATQTINSENRAVTLVPGFNSKNILLYILLIITECIYTIYLFNTLTATSIIYVEMAFFNGII